MNYIIQIIHITQKNMQNEFTDECFNEIISDPSRSDILQILKNLCKTREKILMQRIIDYLFKNNYSYHIHDLLRLAHEESDIDMVDFLIKKNSTKINCLPSQIVHAKYLSSINFFLSCDIKINQISDILDSAIRNRDVEIVELLIKRGMTSLINMYGRIYDRIDAQFMKLLIDNNIINLNSEFVRICEASYISISIEIFKLFIDSGVTNLNDGFIKICKNDLVTEKLIKLFIDSGVTNLNDGFVEICGGYYITKELIKLFIENGITNLNDGFLVICGNKCLNTEFIKLFIDNGITNLNDAFFIICGNYCR